MFLHRENKNAPTDEKRRQDGGKPDAGNADKRKAYVTGSCHYDPSRPCSRKTESGCWSCEFNRSLF